MTQPFHIRKPAVAACTLALAALLHAPEGSAATERVQRISATAVCEAPLPAFDRTLRKRPIGIGNEGTTPIFVSCALPADTVAPPGGATVSVRLAMLSTTTPATVNCNLVTGTPGNLTYTAGTALIAPGGSTWLTWNDIDKGAAGGTLNFSCNLPPQVDLSTIMYREVDAGGGL